MNEIELINWIIGLINKNNIHGFYVSSLWKALRKEILNESNNECQICKSKGIVSIATTVHHIKHLKEHPELALTKSNLMAVCNECHNVLHPEKHFKYEKKIPLNEERW